MIEFWSRYPAPEHPKTRAAIEQHNLGCVVPNCSVSAIYGAGWDLSAPKWDALDERIKAVPGGSQIHCHPLLDRMTFSRWDNVNDYIFPILDRYPQVTRWTLAQELLLRNPTTQANVFRLFEDVGRAYPHLKLWVGEYGLRSGARVYGRAGILDSLLELKAISEGFEGIVVTDYIDFAVGFDGLVVQGQLNWLSVGAKWLTENGMDLDSIESALRALKQRYSLITLGPKLNASFDAIKKTGVKIALETSCYSGAEPDPYTVARQKMAYELLIDLCDRHGAEFWHWNICDEAVGITWDRKRKATDCPGWFDREGNLKGWAADFLP